MKWHKYSEEKPKPLEVCLIKNYKYRGSPILQYKLCEYSYLGEDSEEPWTETSGDGETYGPNYSEYWISVSEIEDCMELEEKYTCSECDRDTDIIPSIRFYKKGDKIYCSCCIYDYLITHKELQELTIEQALKKEGFVRI